MRPTRLRHAPVWQARPPLQIKIPTSDCLRNVSMLLSRMMEGTPAEFGYRMPAEWVRLEVTWLSLPRREGISFWGAFDRALSALREMVAALIESERARINVCNGALRRIA